MRLHFYLFAIMVLIATACTLNQPAAESIESLTTDPPPTATIEPTVRSAPTSTTAPVETVGDTIASDTESQGSSSVEDANNNINCEPAPPEWQAYTVRAGDTLFNLAQSRNSSVNALSSANCLDDAGQINVGQTLYLPPDTSSGSTITQPTPPVPVMELAHYMLVEGDPGTGAPRVGCDLYIVPVDSGMGMPPNNASAIRNALTSLFNTRAQYVGPAGDKINLLYETNLRVDDVSINGDHAVVAISGQLTLMGACSDGAMEAQIVYSVFGAAPNVQKATITLNGENLRQTFDMSGQAGPDFVYSRPAWLQ